MTVGQLRRQGAARLAEAGCESPEFDSFCLAEKAWGLDQQALLLQSGREASPQEEKAFFQLIEERAGRRPLQYILGTWPFMGMELAVGEGVLCPRDDTEVVVRAAAERLRGRPGALYGVDLCGGTGAVALGLCSLLHSLSMDSVEYLEAAWGFLQENLHHFGGGRVRPVRGDVLDASMPEKLLQGPLDVLISNPPYIASEELPGLQEEVRREPDTALDGGPDGLVFYRAIADFWVPWVRPGGVVALEIGEEQADPVCRLLESAGVTGLRVYQDLGGLDRAVTGTRT